MKTTSMLKRVSMIALFFIVVSQALVAQNDYEFTLTQDRSGKMYCKMSNFAALSNGVNTQLFYYGYTAGASGDFQYKIFLDLKDGSGSSAVSRLINRVKPRTKTKVKLTFEDGSTITFNDERKVEVYDNNRAVDVNIATAQYSQFKKLFSSNITSISFPDLNITINTPNFRSAATIKRMKNRIDERQEEEEGRGSGSGSAGSGRSGSGGAGGSGSGSLSTQHNAAGDFNYAGTTRYISVATTSKLKFLKDNIIKWEGVRIGTITEAGAGVGISGNNAYTITAGTPEGMKDKIKELNGDRSNNYKILDLHVTENNNYMLIYGKNGWASNGAPQGLRDALRKYHDEGDTFTSISFNDNGLWGFVSIEHIDGDDVTSAFLKKALENFGKVISVCITNYGRIACCENGVYYENVPQNLVQKLQEISFKPKYIKFTDNGLYLITGEKESQYAYFM